MIKIRVKMDIQTSCFYLLTIVFGVTYETVSEPSIMYLGCFEDGGPNNRLMPDHNENFLGSLTPDKCNIHCRGKGFPYAGTQYSYECFCSKTKPPDGMKMLESDCNSKCAGDETKTCGGNNRLAVFTTGIPDPLDNDEESLLSLGCFKDSETRLLSGYRKDFPGSLTNQKCVKLCRRKEYRYAGTEYGKECHCGDRKPSFREYANDEECSKRCDGDGKQLCGGNWKLFITQTSHTDVADPPDGGKYIGCYKDDENSRQLDGLLEDFGSFLTPLKCTGLCYSKGFLYSGTQFSYQCFCGDKPPNPTRKLPDKECNKPCSGNPMETCGGPTRNSIRETGIPDMPVNDKYLGCYNDHNNQIFGQSHMYTFDKTNTPRRCMNFCAQLGFGYSGVEYGKECFCGHKEPKTKLAVNHEDCNTPCSGDPLESCGAGWRLAVYTTNSTAVVNPNKPTTERPCVPTETIVPGKNSICKGDVVFEDHFSTPLGNRWRHVIMIPDSPQENLYPDIDMRLSNKKIKRSTNLDHDKPLLVTEEKVEFLGFYVDKIAHKDEISIFGELIASRINKLNTRNQDIARNRISKILDELEKEELRNSSMDNTNREIPEADTTLNPDTSTSTTSSGSQESDEEEEFEFAVFTSDQKNSFSTENRLVIKPTFYNDTFIQSGTLHLDGCTGRAGSRQCELRASSYNIIPPVKSARIHTRDSFSFRYGIVEIRAKLPLGDWLVPELWLEPRHHFYGPGYTSGRIRIAMHRGNSDFRCHGEDFGSHRLESGVMMGPADNVQKRSLTTRLPPNWHDQFHNYTLIWSPESISFKIDREEAQDLIPAGRRLCEVIGFKNEECLTWSAGSRIAPFDNDFYISLGLSVGNARDFPDDCTNKGRPKPWKNTDPKAMLHLWLDRENWNATWTEENSSLYIEHIRVTAI